MTLNHAFGMIKVTAQSMLDSLDRWVVLTLPGLAFDGSQRLTFTDAIPLRSMVRS